MKVRIATLDDVQQIAELHAQSWQNSYQGHLDAEYLVNRVPRERMIYWQQNFERSDPSQRIFVAELDGTIAGFACVVLDKDTTWGSYLDNLHVSQKYQSKGIGKGLLKAVANMCDQQANSDALCLLVTQFNAQAQRFYFKCGANRQSESSWLAPDGTTVPTYWFTWDSVQRIRNI